MLRNASAVDAGGRVSGLRISAAESASVAHGASVTPKAFYVLGGAATAPGVWSRTIDREGGGGPPPRGAELVHTESMALEDRRRIKDRISCAA